MNAYGIKCKKKYNCIIFVFYIPKCHSESKQSLTPSVCATFLTLSSHLSEGGAHSIHHLHIIGTGAHDVIIVGRQQDSSFIDNRRNIESQAEHRAAWISGPCRQCHYSEGGAIVDGLPYQHRAWVCVSWMEPRARGRFHFQDLWLIVCWCGIFWGYNRRFGNCYSPAEKCGNTNDTVVCWKHQKLVSVLLYAEELGFDASSCTACKSSQGICPHPHSLYSRRKSWL